MADSIRDAVAEAIACQRTEGRTQGAVVTDYDLVEQVRERLAAEATEG